MCVHVLFTMDLFFCVTKSWQRLIYLSSSQDIDFDVKEESNENDTNVKLETIVEKRRQDEKEKRTRTDEECTRKS